MKVKIVNSSKYPLPEYQTEGAAGIDLYADIDEEIELAPLERQLTSTGIALELPIGYEAQIRPRSGLAHKHGVSVVNSPGTIDSDYRGIIYVNLVNLSNEPFTIKPGERIAQMVICKYEVVEFNVVEELDTTDRGSGGHGSTGQ